jgi:ABC-type dipeptide/oligopeptide/nickel transport system permease subunit
VVTDSLKFTARIRLLATYRKMVIGAIVIFIFVVITILANEIAPFPFDKMGVGGLLAKPSYEHIMGTDNFGRDILSRVIVGGRTSLGVAFLATLIAAFLGVGLGTVSGFIGGRFDLVLMRFADVLTAIPWILMAIVITAILGPGEDIVIYAMGLTFTPEIMRVMRGESISIKHREYIEAAHAIGEGKGSMMLRYVLPNCASTIIVQSTLVFSKAILMEAAISYLGFGVQPPMTSWGLLLADSQKYMWQAPYFAIFPGLVIVCVVLAINLFGDGLRDKLDPKHEFSR